MITIEFLSLPKITRVIGKKTITLPLEGKTIKNLLSELANSYGQEVGDFLFDESGNLDAILKILLNKKEWIKRDQVGRVLESGDVVTIMMLVGGG